MNNIVNNIYAINNTDFTDIRLKFNIPSNYSSLYDTFRAIISSYNDELNDVLILSKPRNLKLFFRNINTRLKFIRNEMTQMKSGDAKDYIINEITLFIKYNLKIAKSCYKEEKVYEFESGGCLDHNNIDYLLT